MLLPRIRHPLQHRLFVGGAICDECVTFALYIRIDLMCDTKRSICDLMRPTPGGLLINHFRVANNVAGIRLRIKNWIRYSSNLPEQASSVRATRFGAPAEAAILSCISVNISSPHKASCSARKDRTAAAKNVFSACVVNLFQLKNQRFKKLKPRVRAKVEHPFQFIKCQFQLTKVRYKVLVKNSAQRVTLFALSNL